MNRNKMAKKVLAGMISAAMLAAVPAYAESTGSADNDRITVNYSLNTTYMLSIPASIDLSSTESKKVENIGLKEVNTTPAQKVQVKIKEGITNNQVVLERDGDTTTKVVSDVTDGQGNKVSIGSVIAEFEDMSITPITTGTGVLNFSAVKDSENAQATVKAGSYKGTIVFAAETVNRQ